MEPKRKQSLSSPNGNGAQPPVRLSASHLAFEYRWSSSASNCEQALPGQVHGAPQDSLSIPSPGVIRPPGQSGCAAFARGKDDS